MTLSTWARAPWRNGAAERCWWSSPMAATRSAKWTTAMLCAAQQAEAIVYSLIVVPVEASAGRDTGGEHALIQLSEDTGGKYYYASSLAQLDSAFKQISDELRAQYLLAYYPSQRVSNSEFRRIQVTVSGPPASAGDRVRHRTGYYSAKPDF